MNTSKKSLDSRDPNPDKSKATAFDEEILNILSNAQSYSSVQIELPLPILSDSESNDDPLSPPPAIQDPDRAHVLYYKKLDPLLKKYLVDPEAKKLIREQVNIFLKEGRSHGRDGRQSYYHQLESAIVMIKKWVDDTKGKDLVNLYVTFVEKNHSLGYLK